MFILNKEKYLLNENIKQAKSFLKKEYDLDVDQDKHVVFEYIKELLKKLPNLVYTFTKLIFKEGATDLVVEEARNIINWYKENKNIVKQLPKNLTQYESLEEISDDIVKLEDQIKIKKFYKSLYNSMRSEIDRLGEEDKEKFNQLALAFMDLDEEYQKLFTPLKYFEKNGISINEFLETLDKFINKSDVNERKKDVLDYVKEHKINIVYNENNVLVVETSDHKHVCNLGSDKWCIVYSDSYYDSYLNENKYNTQYFIFNFNLPASNPNSEFGITIDPTGKTLHGGSQNKNNSPVALDKIYEMTGIPSGLLGSKYEDIYNAINSGTLDMIEYAKNNGISKTIKKLEEPIKIGNTEVDIPKDSLQYFQEDNQENKILFNTIYYYNNLIDLLKDFRELKGTDEQGSFLKAFDKEASGKSIRDIFNTYEIVSAEKTIEEIGVGFLGIILASFNSNIQERTLEYLTGSNGGYLKLISEVSKTEPIDTPRNIIYESSYNMLSEGGFEPFYNILEKGNEVLYNVFENTKMELNFRDDMKLLTSEQYEKLLNIDQVAKNKELSMFTANIIKQEEAINLFDKDMFNLIGSKEFVKPLSEYLSNMGSLTKVNETIRKIQKLDKENYPYLRDVANEFKLDKTIITTVINDLMKISETEELLTYIINNEYILSWLILDLSVVLKAQKKEAFDLKELYTIIIILKMVRSNASARHISKIVSESIIKIDGIDDASIIQDQINDLRDNKEDNFKELQIYFNMSNIYGGMKNKPTLKEYENEINVFLGEILDMLFNGDRIFKTFGEYYTFFGQYDKLIKRDYLTINDDNDDNDSDYLSENIHSVIINWVGNNEKKILSKYSENKIGLDTMITKYIKEYSMDKLSEELYYENQTEDLDVIKIIGYSIDKDEELLESLLNEGNSFALLSLVYYDSKYNEYLYKNIGMEYDEEEENWVYISDWETIEGLFDQSDYGNFSLENYYEMFESNFNDFDYFNDSYDGGLNEISITNLENIIKIIKAAGLEIDTSILDKYTNQNYDYKESQDIYKEDKELVALRDDVESILKMNYDVDDEDFYEKFDPDSIISEYNFSYNMVENDAQAYNWYKLTLNRLSDILKYLKSGDIAKETKDGLKVIPDIWEMCNNDYFLINLRDYSGLEKFDISNMFKAYTEAVGLFDPYSGDNYISFIENDFEHFNEEFNNRLYDLLPQEANESVVLKYSDFIKEELDQRFIGEFEDEDRAEEEWEWYNNMIKDLNKNGGEVYRLVFLDNISDLDDKELGEHWCLEFDQLSIFYDSLEGAEGELPYLIKGYLKPNQIDVDKSIETSKELPHELEVNLKGEPFKFEVSAYRGTPKADSIWNNRI